MSYYKRGLGWHGHKTLQGQLTDNKQSCVDSDASQVLASSLTDVLNSTVFSCCGKAASDCTSLTGCETWTDTCSHYNPE